MLDFHFLFQFVSRLLLCAHCCCPDGDTDHRRLLVERTHDDPSRHGFDVPMHECRGSSRRSAFFIGGFAGTGQCGERCRRGLFIGGSNDLPSILLSRFCSSSLRCHAVGHFVVFLLCGSFPLQVVQDSDQLHQGMSEANVHQTDAVEPIAPIATIPFVPVAAELVRFDCDCMRFMVAVCFCLDVCVVYKLNS